MRRQIAVPTDSGCAAGAGSFVAPGCAVSGTRRTPSGVDAPSPR
jgi:hypothetical protein